MGERALIFVTVGTQLPFDRLIKTVDEWSGINPTVNVFAQIGPTDFQPRHLESVTFLSPDRVDYYFKNAELIVSHAGMGSIISALKYKKPILIFPRLSELGEHRNNHQVATAKRFGERTGVFVAWSEDDIRASLDRRQVLVKGDDIAEMADSHFIARLRGFICKALNG